LMENGIVNAEGKTAYLNDHAEAEFTLLAGSVDMLHLPAKTYRELEQDSSIEFDPQLAKRARTAVAVTAHSPDFAAINSVPSVSSECIVLDARRDDLWVLFEQSRFKKLLGGPSRQVTGAIWLLEENVFSSLPSDKFGRFVGEEIERWSMSKADVLRVFSVALGACWLVQHDRVIVSALDSVGDQKHFRLEIPENLSAVDAIQDVLNGRHIRRKPSAFGRLLRAGLNIFHRARQAGSSPDLDPPGEAPVPLPSSVAEAFRAGINGAANGPFDHVGVIVHVMAEKHGENVQHWTRISHWPPCEPIDDRPNAYRVGRAFRGGARWLDKLGVPMEIGDDILNSVVRMGNMHLKMHGGRARFGPGHVAAAIANSLGEHSPYPAFLKAAGINKEALETAIVDYANSDPQSGD
jgi:hypothetical protein